MGSVERAVGRSGGRRGVQREARQRRPWSSAGPEEKFWGCTLSDPEPLPEELVVFLDVTLVRHFLHFLFPISPSERMC